MSIESDRVRIEGYEDSDGNQALAIVESATNLAGSGTHVRLINMGACGVYWLANREDNPRDDYILLLPSARWEQDARDAGYNLVQKLNQRET